MEKVADPFADGTVKAHNDEKMDHVHSKKFVPPINFELVIRRLAEIEDELERRGVSELIEQKEILRKALKDAMTAGGTDIEYDETSNFEATIVPRFKDEWDVDVLQRMLSAAQHARYTVLIADEASIKVGITTGDFSKAIIRSTTWVRSSDTRSV